jgi:integrase
LGVYTRPDSPFFWLWLEGHTNDRGKPLRERTDLRNDAPSAEQRKKNRALAEDRYHKRMAELAAGAMQPDKKPAITFEGFAAWFDTNVLPKRRGREREAEMLRRLVAFFGPLPLSAIDRATVEEYTAKRLTTPTVIKAKRRTAKRTVQAGASTINREVDLLKAVLQSAAPKYLEASPLYGMKRLATTTPKRRVLTEDEEARLLKVMPQTDQAFFLIGLDTLARLSDILDLRVSDDHGDRLWVADPKTGGGFFAPISTRLRKALDALKPADGQMFMFPRRRLASTERDRRNGIRQMLERYCALANPPIEYGRAHGLTFHWATRRTAASRMLSRRVPLATVQKVGRWKDPTVVLGIYHEMIGDDDRQAVEAISGSTHAPLTRQPKKSKKTKGNRRAS